MARRVATLVAAFAVPALIGSVVARWVSDDRSISPSSTAPPAATDSISALEARASSRPDDARVWQQLAAAYSREAARTQDAALFDLASRAVGKAIELAPGEPDTHVAAGTVALGAHRFHDAAASGKSALALRPDDRSALAVSIDAAVELGRYDEAATFAQRLADLRPDATALARISYLRELHGDITGARDAMRAAEQAAAATPAEAAVIASLVGDLELHAGDIDAAAAAFGRGKSEVGQARIDLARGRTPDAIERLRRQISPVAARLLGSLADGEGFDVVRANDRLLENAGVRLELESALFEADHGSPQRAVVLAEAAYRDRATIFTADALGWSLYRAGRAGEAVPYARESLRTGSRSAGLRLHAAVILGSADDLRIAFASGPWFAPELRPDAAAAAARLGVAVPTTWQMPS